MHQKLFDLGARDWNRTRVWVRFVNIANGVPVQLNNFDQYRKLSGARDRNRTGTPAMNEAADFKSAVSTDFTTRAA